MKGRYELEQVAVRLVKEAPLISEEEIHSPEDAIRILGEKLQDYDREVVGVVHLRSDGAPISMAVVSMGELNRSMVHPREVLKAAFLSNAASIILFHNHPSGDIKPSKQDVLITGRMQQVCTLAGIPLMDHIILGRDRSYYSFREKDKLPKDEIVYPTELRSIDLKAAEKKAEEYGLNK